MIWAIYLGALVLCGLAILAIKKKFGGYGPLPLDLSPEELMPHESHEQEGRDMECPACKARRVKVFYYDMTGRLVVCRECAHYWVESRG